MSKVHPLLAARKAHGISLRELGAEAGINFRMLHTIEKGLSSDEVKALRDAFKRITGKRVALTGL